MQIVTCTKCGATNAPGVRFCGKCGTPLAGAAPSASSGAASAAQSCPRCGAANQAGVRFCGKCGAPMQEAAEVATSPEPPVEQAAPVPPPAGVLTCGSCGSSNQAGVRFCGKCGAPLQTPAAGPAQAGGLPAAQMICSRCGTANQPGVRFCGKCGQTLGTAAVPAHGHGLATFHYPLASRQQVYGALPRKTTAHHPAWPLLVALVGVAMALLAVAAHALEATPTPACTVHCQPPPPPAGPPLPEAHQYTSSTYGYSVDYSDEAGSPTITDAGSIGWGGSNDSFLIKFQGDAANGRSAQQIVTSVQQSVAQGATLIFAIPGAELGYQSGYGAIYDLTVSPPGGQQEDERFAIEASIVNDVAVEMIAASPFVADKNDHPSPAQLNPAVERVSDYFGDSVTWKGQSPL